MISAWFLLSLIPVAILFALLGVYGPEPRVRYRTQPLYLSFPEGRWLGDLERLQDFAVDQGRGLIHDEKTSKEIKAIRKDFEREMLAQLNPGVKREDVKWHNSGWVTYL